MGRWSTCRWPTGRCPGRRWSPRRTSPMPSALTAARQPGLPIKLDRTPGAPDRPPGPALGEHTEAVLAAAGYSEEEIAELLAGGAAAGPAETQHGATLRA